MENLSVDKLLNFVINGNLIEFRLGLRFKIDNSILINFVKKLTKQTNLKKLYIFSEYDLDIKNLVKKLHKSNLEFFYINDENLLDCVTEISTKKK